MDTHSTISAIANARTGEKVLEYADAEIAANDFAPLAMALCNLFCNGDGDGAFFCWEMHGPGLVFAKRFLDLGYRNIWYHRDEQPDQMAPTTSDRWCCVPSLSESRQRRHCSTPLLPLSL